MNTKIFGDLTFITGVLRSKEIAYLVARNKTLDPIDYPQSKIFVWHNKEWIDGGNVPWNCVAVTVLKNPFPQMLLVGPVGEALVMGSGDVHQERIGDQDHMPSTKAMIRGVGFIGEHAYAIGMQRQVYKRINAGKWQLVGPHQKNHESAAGGFESIDGFDEKDIYTVGWNGEIWHYNGRHWIQYDSPTNLILNAVTCAENGMVYACGQCGVLLRGRKDKWEVIDHQKTDLDLWDMTWFNGKLYISSMECLYCLSEDGLKTVDLGGNRQFACYHLTSVDNRMWSIGSDNVMMFDGCKWRQIA